MDDFEDAFDVDEYDAGEIDVSIDHVTTSGNHDEGLDLAKKGPATCGYGLHGSSPRLNVDEGIKPREASESTVRDNAGDGINAAQAAPGQDRLRLHEVTLGGNAGEDVVTESVEVFTEER